MLEDPVAGGQVREIHCTLRSQVNLILPVGCCLPLPALFDERLVVLQKFTFGERRGLSLEFCEEKG